MSLPRDQALVLVQKLPIVCPFCSQDFEHCFHSFLGVHILHLCRIVVIIHVNDTWINIPILLLGHPWESSRMLMLLCPDFFLPRWILGLHTESAPWPLNSQQVKSQEAKQGESKNKSYQLWQRWAEGWQEVRGAVRVPICRISLVYNMIQNYQSELRNTDGVG